MGEIVIEKLNDFTEQLKRLNITKIAFTEINEKRAEQVESNLLQVVDIIKLELLAYKDSTIYKCPLKDIDFEEINHMLESAGFEVTRRSRNIT